MSQLEKKRSRGESPKPNPNHKKNQIESPHKAIVVEANTSSRFPHRHKLY